MLDGDSGEPIPYPFPDWGDLAGVVYTAVRPPVSWSWVGPMPDDGVVSPHPEYDFGGCPMRRPPQTPPS
jgi:hypothetical protein